MTKAIIGDLNSGLVRYEGLLVPRKIKVVFSDPEGVPGNRKPSITVQFEVGEDRLKCVSIALTASKDTQDIRSTLLQEIKVDALGIEAFEAVALERRAEGGDEVRPARLEVGRAAAKKLADNVSQLSRQELLHIGFHYSNPANSKSPTQAVWKALGYGSRHTAIRRIQAARDKGWVLPRDATPKEIVLHFEELQSQMGQNG
jgi:hypothetical protein